MSSTSAASAPGSERSPTASKSASKINVPKRAHTFQSGTNPERASPFDTTVGGSDHADANETTDNDDAGDVGRMSVDMGELPIELVSLTDR